MMSRQVATIYTRLVGQVVFQALREIAKELDLTNPLGVWSQIPGLT
jgi:hypothetical protein